MLAFDGQDRKIRKMGETQNKLERKPGIRKRLKSLVHASSFSAFINVCTFTWRKYFKKKDNIGASDDKCVIY